MYIATREAVKAIWPALKKTQENPAYVWTDKEREVIGRFFKAMDKELNTIKRKNAHKAKVTAERRKADPFYARSQKEIDMRQRKLAKQKKQPD